MPAYVRGNPAHWWKNRSCGYASRAPRAAFISPFRRLTSLGTLALLILLFAGVWYVTRPARISRMAETLLSNVLGGHVAVTTGHLSLSGTLLLSDVRVQTDPASSGHPLPLFSADQIEARFDWLSLFAGQLRATQLTAIRPTLYLIEDRQADHWNYEMLRKKGAATRPMTTAPAKPIALPVLILRDARVQWGEFANNRLTQTAYAIIDGQFTPTPADPSTYRFQFTQQPGQGSGNAKSPVGNALVNVTGTWDIGNNRFTAVAQDIVLSDALRDVLPRQVREWWSEHHLEGRFSQLWVSFDNDAGPVIGADLDRVSMQMLASPRPNGPSYPVNLSDIRGSLRFGVSKASVEANIRGRLLGYDFEAVGAIAGAAPDSPFDLHIRFPDANLGEDYPPLFLAFPDSQDLIQRIAPHGKFDVSIGVNRIGGTRDIHLDGNIFCDDARMRFGPFPYPLDHVKGHVRFNENTVTFDDVIAHADENVIHIQGTTGTTPANKEINFRVWSDDSVFDDRLAACLPGDFKAIWDQFVLQARGKFDCVVKRAAGNAGAPDVHVDLTLTDGFGYAKAFPYRFSHAHGQLVLTADQSYVNNFQITTGGDHSGVIRFNGIIRHPGGDVRNLMPELHATADVPLDISLLNAIPEEYTDKIRNLDFSGRCGFDGIFQRKPVEDPNGERAPLDVAGNVTLRQVSVRSHDGALDLRDVDADAHLSGTHLDLQSATGRILNNLHLSANGAVELAQPSAHLQLAAHGRDVVVPRPAPTFLPDGIRNAWNAYNVQGKVDVDANAVLHAGTPAAGTPTTAPDVAATMPAPSPAPAFAIDDYSCTLVPKALSISHADWPASIDDIQGRILLAPGRVAFQQLTANSGPLALSCDGTYHIDTGECDLRASATSDGLATPWLAKLPGDFSKFLTDHKTSGQFRLNVDTLQRAASGKPWTFDAELAARNFAMDGALNIEADRVGLTSNGTWNGGVFDFTGMINGANVSFSGKTLDTLQAAVAMSSKDQTLHISDIDGKVAGGVTQGNMTVRFGTGGDHPTQAGYDATLMLHDADLSRLLLPKTATEDERKRIGDGRVSATLAVQQTFGPHPDRTGRGELIIHDGKIYNVPLAMGLMQLVTLRLPVARAFDQAAMSYYLRDNKVTFEKILLESPTINLAGAGTMSLADKALDLNFVTESPNELKLPLISSLVNEIRAQLLQLAVTGTIDNPKITPVPLSSIASPLRNLLPKKKQASP
ncbi:MAG: hypothetical protein ACTHN5_12715 [Phycisphaerae bacterium]